MPYKIWFSFARPSGDGMWADWGRARTTPPSPDGYQPSVNGDFPTFLEADVYAKYCQELYRRHGHRDIVFRAFETGVNPALTRVQP